MNNENIRREIISKIIRIPDENLDSIKDYVDFVIEKGKKKRTPEVKKENSKTSRKKTKTALEKLAGIANTGGRLAKGFESSFGKVSVEPFADKIDEILYGESYK